MGRSKFVKNTILEVAIGIVGGLFVGALFGKGLSASNLHKWRNRMENKQIDTDIRLDLLEYNHLHEDGHLRVLFEDLDRETI